MPSQRAVSPAVNSGQAKDTRTPRLHTPPPDVPSRLFACTRRHSACLAILPPPHRPCAPIQGFAAQRQQMAQHAASLGIKKHPHTGTRHKGQKGHKSGVQGTEISHRCNRPSFTETLSVSTMSPVGLNVGNIDGPTHYCRAGYSVQSQNTVKTIVKL